MQQQFRIWILTLFPDYFSAFQRDGVVGQLLAGKRGSDIFRLNIVNIRDYGVGQYKAVDDYPFGGGPGMILRPDVLERALLDGVVQAGKYNSVKELYVIYTSARGELWDFSRAQQIHNDFWQSDKQQDLVFICGRYEGVDERFIEQYVDKEYSLGNFVLSGGELAVMVILDSALRLTEGSLGNKDSAREDSFYHGLLDYPQYTRPADFNGSQIPEVLLSGHHANIEKWKQEAKLEQTRKYKPELLVKREFYE